MTPLYFCIFKNYLPFEEDLALYLNNFERPLPKDDLYERRLIEIILLVLETSIFRIFSAYFVLLFLFFGRGIVLHLNTSESPSPKNDLCKVCLQSAQQLWRRSKK
jgi:hypothetical protein